MFRRIRSFLAITLALTGLALLLVWGMGRVLSDRYGWSQYLSWLPTMPVLGTTILLVGFSWVTDGGDYSALSRRARILAALGILGGIAYLLIVEWRLHRRLPPETDALAILSWNASNTTPDQVARLLLEHRPDVAALANASWASSYPDLGKHLEAEVITPSGFLLASRLPILRWGVADLGIDAREGGHPDPGRAFYAELELPGGGSLILWIIDLPSDPRLSRTGITRRAAERLRDWSGIEHVRSEWGWEARPRSHVAFPAPDLIVGDFNIPRGAASLRALTAGLTDAFSQGGRGDASTWPRRRPLWAIDQAFVAPPRRLIRYHVLDPGCGDHRFLWLRMSP